MGEMENQFGFGDRILNVLLVNVGDEFDCVFEFVRIGKAEFVTGLYGFRVFFGRTDKIVNGMMENL